MKITKGRMAENRARVVEEAARLFREKGFDGVCVAELMAAAGMTHGGFYNHFNAKNDLEAAAFADVLGKAVALVAAIAEEPDPAARMRGFLDYRASYISPAARDASAASCPMVAFAGDVSRRSEGVRDAYAKGLAVYLDVFAKASGLPREEAIGAFVSLVSSLTLARSVAAADPELSDEILAAARLVASQNAERR
jgi:TetR/AcrR family transcriptional repressor of nem operon